MPMTHHSLLSPMGQMCRTVSATLIAGVWRSRSIAEVEGRIKRLGLREQAGVVGGVLGLLLLLSLFAAQFGIPGLLVFWLGVIALVN
ncbi:hypothetical protein [Rhodobaculum claviforme]|uniref:Uncharacterized protein n=1 Tax=Rhodobaculum claviforme TaxID=1549854 RepID=A0A934TMN5_9RHOB|nr:hypothetical protein [Rhodobaculum claviforme]MBK5928924.1 hypothetical protein [Rhodobaculum claviforme]